LEFTTDAVQGVEHGMIQFIAVGTPPDEDGSADLKYVLAVAETIAKHMDGYRCVVNKSTVPVGTADKVSVQIAAVLNSRRLAYPVDVVSNPEFLKEGAAVSDCQRPDRIIIGTSSSQAEQLLRELYEPFNRNHDKFIVMDVRSAELTKYAANCMLATKISFMNEMANLSERLGADIEAVRKGIGSDPRIGYHFIYPGCGYGGSCFPKDVQALAHTAQEIGYDAQLLQAVEALNNRQKTTLFAKIAQHFGGESELKGRTIAVWGLAFKPNTDDMRAAPSRTLMEALWKAGAQVNAFDPVAMSEAARIYGVHPNLNFCADQYAALQDADALVICTEWQQFRAPNFTEMAARIRNKVIVDGRNLYQPQKLQADGWSYLSVGRSALPSISLQG
jgi:UDPglucose 6-dehydrogenase